MDTTDAPNLNEEKTTSFEEFWKETKLSTDSTSLSVSSFEIPTAIATGIQQILFPAGVAFWGFNNTLAEVDRFSKEVANYVTSDEVISLLSEKIGEPKTNETEAEFVKRASHVLREILKKKFRSNS